MKDLKRYKKQGIVLLILCAAVAVAIISYFQNQSQENKATVSYEDVGVTTTTIQQTLTAAGEVETVKEENLFFSKTKTFKGMCVEVKDYVAAGGHIALYSDGSYLNADVSGVVSAVNAPRTGTKGDGVYAVTFLPSDQITINLTVPEDEIGRIGLGNEAKVVINAEPDKDFRGTITYVSGSSNASITDQDGDAKIEDSAGDGSDAADGETDGETDDGSMTEATTETGDTPVDNGAYYKAIITLDNDGSLKIGMSASCTVLLAEKQDVLAVPVNAVHIADDYRYVNVVADDGSVTKTKVETGISDATYVEIVSGLTGSEKVRVEAVLKEKAK